MTMSHEEAVIRAIRAEVALKAIRRYAEQSSFGGWRHQVAALVDEGLGRA